jgi:D-alanyl-D-alanine carboxypeptidase/D-alanyl-D-alanine-endopeptidase (penicillin-binding protein 4)
MKKTVSILAGVILAGLIFSACATSKSTGVITPKTKLALANRLQEIMSPAEFDGAHWGMEFSFADSNEMIYSLNSEEYFQPASAVKIFTAGTAYSALGQDYRFNTAVYRTGPVENGVLKGNVIVRAGGDFLLGGRINPDGTLALPDPDHTYDMSFGAQPVSDDPLRSIREMAEQISARGIKKIDGLIIVDNSLFREEMGEGGGTGVFTVSPMMINDNLVDVVISPGPRPGAPAVLQILPETPYLNIINKTNTTGASENSSPEVRMFIAPGSGMLQSMLRFIDDITHEDGTHTVTITGDIPVNSAPVLRAYRVPEPARFAEIVFTMALREKGIDVQTDRLPSLDLSVLPEYYTDENKIAELVSPSLAEELKPMLKVSSNPHTVTWPYVTGAITGHNGENAREAGDAIQDALFLKTGVEKRADAPAGDAPPGNVPPGMERTNVMGLNQLAPIVEWLYSPKSYTNFLTYLTKQPYLREFMNALPVLGTDGTLAGIQAESPAAGHIYAKPGSALMLLMTRERGAEPVPKTRIVKALAGFIELPNGRIVVFSEFLEYETQSADTEPANRVMGELVSAVYESLTN